MVVPKAAHCETFPAIGAPEEGVEPLRCLSCTQPLRQENELLALGGIAGGSQRDRDGLKKRFLFLLQSTGLALPDSRLLSHTDFFMLLVPWAYRGELRAMLAQAAATWKPEEASVLNPPKPGSPATSRDSRPGDSSFASSLPVGGMGSIDHRLFKQQLNDFGLAFDGPVQMAMRTLLVGEGRRTWRFPLGCNVLELQARRQVSWTIHFDDLELLERAYVLLTPVLREMERLGSRLRPDDAGVEVHGDDVETQMPALCIASVGNTQQARVEMVRLIKNLILTLDRLGICEEPERLSV